MCTDSLVGKKGENGGRGAPQQKKRFVAERTRRAKSTSNERNHGRVEGTRAQLHGQGAEPVGGERLAPLRAPESGADPSGVATSLCCCDERGECSPVPLRGEEVGLMWDEGKRTLVNF